MSPGQLDLPLKGEEAIGSIEEELRRRSIRQIIGVDEAGRGPLAGPVVVGAVLLEPDAVDWVADLNDSKRLSAQRRDYFFDLIRERLPHVIVRLSPAEIDELNILQATLEGMRRGALAMRELAPDAPVLVDGKTPVPGVEKQRCLVGGDHRSLAIAAASVLAKVSRDREMEALDQEYPGYGFAQHKGYPTRAHLEALERLGPTPVHRRSFGPVRALLESEG